MRKGFTLIELMIVIAIIAIIAAIAIPNLLESRVTANEAAASASLKSGVFPGQVQFQGGGYQDADADNVGEYGPLRALAGLNATNKIGGGSIKLLQGPLASDGSWSAGTTNKAGTATGYRYLAIAPSDTDTTDVTIAVWNEGDAAPTEASSGNANNGERYWVCAAAPEKFGDTGRRAFLVSNDGQVRSPSTTAGINAFYSAAATNGISSTGSTLEQGIQYAYTGTAAVLAITTIGSDFHTSVPVYAR